MCSVQIKDAQPTTIARLTLPALKVANALTHAPSATLAITSKNALYEITGPFVTKVVFNKNKTKIPPQTLTAKKSFSSFIVFN